MTRLERKNRKDIIYKGYGGLTDAFDDAFKNLWRINDEEYDYLCETLSNEDLSAITPEFKTISEIKRALIITNNSINYYRKIAS